MWKKGRYVSVKFSSDCQLHTLQKVRYLTVCTDQYGRRSPPQGLIVVHTNGMPEHSRNQIDYRLVSTGPARLCNQVSTLIDEKGRLLQTFIVRVETACVKDQRFSRVGVNSAICIPKIPVDQ